MKVVILAGGLGTRLAEETALRPKPMVEIGDRPILWHIMKIYAAYGMTDFVVCLGYKGYIIKEYFLNYALHMSDVRINTASKHVDILQNRSENWNVTLVDTGQHTMTGGRLRRVREFLGDDDFCFTYGDGVGDVAIPELLDYHRREGRQATMTVTRPVGRFGIVTIEPKGGKVLSFREKADDEGWVNAGFFVLSPKVIDYIAGDEIMWERQPLEQLAAVGQLSAYRHPGFWLPMDTLRDKQRLEELWTAGTAPWVVW
jgi:glucose-1-phosphate cytidylyltransferase